MLVFGGRVWAFMFGSLWVLRFRACSLGREGVQFLWGVFPEVEHDGTTLASSRRPFLQRPIDSFKFGILCRPDKRRFALTCESAARVRRPPPQANVRLTQPAPQKNSHLHGSFPLLVQVSKPLILNPRS